MVPSKATEGRSTISGSDPELLTTHDAEISGRGLHCAFQSPAFDGLKAVSSKHYPTDIQQCAVFDGDRDNARRIGTEFVVTEKIFRMLPEDEKLLWHSHNAEVEHGSLSSLGTQEVLNTYGRVVRSLENDSEKVLPLALSQLLTPSSDSGLEKRHVSFLEDEVKSEKSTQGLEEVTRPGEEQAEGAPHQLEIGKEDEYLNDSIHRPFVNHKSSHVPALTEERLPDDGQFLTETRSARF